MAATLEAARLTEAARLAQAQIGAETARLSLTIWNLLDLESIDATVDPWLSLMVPMIQAQRQKSAALAGNYMTAFRALELGPSSFTPTLADLADEQLLRTSLTVTGPIRFRQALAAGRNLQQAGELANTAAARASMRQAMNGGRDTLLETVNRDRHALGWARTASGKACHFCAMLASRGPAYKGEATAHFHAHDGCSCGVEPVYTADAEWPAGSRHYQQVWRESTKGLSGDEATRAFRRALAA